VITAKSKCTDNYVLVNIGLNRKCYLVLIRFGEQFEGKIANDDIVVFKRKSTRADPIYMDVEALQDLVLDSEVKTNLFMSLYVMVEHKYSSDMILLIGWCS